MILPMQIVKEIQFGVYGPEGLGAVAFILHQDPVGAYHDLALEAGEKIVKHFLALLGRKWDQILDESNDQRDPENFVTHDTENGDWRIVIDSTNLPEFRDGMLASLIAPLAAFHGWTIFGLDDKGEVVDDHHLGELISEEEEAREGYGKTLRWLEDHNLATCHGLMRLTESTLRDNYECPEELIPSVRKIANAIGMKLR